jgi:NADPH:quinone reductase-like Zn-dependent oxidoreductase
MSLPNTMRAYQLVGHGGPEKLVYRTDVAVPTPAPGEVLIEVSACGINNTDIWVREGAYGTDEDPTATASWRRWSEASSLVFPRIQGADIVGRIAAVGPRVSPSRIGERVIVDFSIYNSDGESLADIDYIGHGRDGGFAEYATVPAENAYKTHSAYSDAELATFCCAYLTAEQMLSRADVKVGERVLITGASGGVGSALVQLVRARDAIPFAIVGAGKESAVAAIGAEAVITRGAGPLPLAVASATGGNPIDVVADVIGGPIFHDLLNILRPEGRYSTAGAIAGAIVELDLRTLYLKQLQMHGSSQGTRSAFRRLLGYIESGRIKPLLSATYPLEQLPQAQKAFRRKEFVGKIAIVVRPL